VRVQAGLAIEALAIEARGLFKSFDGKPAVSGIDIAVPTGSIYGILGPNGAGKTTTIRMLLGIIDPDQGQRWLLGNDRPLDVATQVGYLPEERGLYPAMKCREAVAFMGALRGLPIDIGRKRAETLLKDNGLGDYVDKPIKSLSKGMAQTVQLFGTIVHHPKLIVLDEPFSGLDAINQGRLEQLIREEAAGGTTVIFSTHVIAHAERLCERIAIIAAGKVRFEGQVAEARDRLPPRVRLETRADDGPWRAALPGSAKRVGREWQFDQPAGGIEPRPARRLRADRRRGRRPANGSTGSGGRIDDELVAGVVGHRPARLRSDRLFAQLHHLYPGPDFDHGALDRRRAAWRPFSEGHVTDRCGDNGQRHRSGADERPRSSRLADQRAQLPDA